MVIIDKKKINLKKYSPNARRSTIFQVLKIIISLLFPFIFISAYVFGIYEKNLQTVNFSQVIDLYQTFILYSVLIFIIFLAATKNFIKTGLITSLVNIWLLNYKFFLTQFSKFIQIESWQNYFWLIGSILVLILITLIYFFIKKNLIASLVLLLF